jgi:hypothetical protein
VEFRSSSRTTRNQLRVTCPPRRNQAPIIAREKLTLCPGGIESEADHEDYAAREDHGEYWLLTTATPKLYQEHARFFAWCTRQDVRGHTYFNYSSTTTHCAATTRHLAARALRQPCRAPRVLVSRSQRLYIDYAVRRRDVVFWAYDYFDYSPRLVNLSRAATTSSTTSRIHLQLVDFSSNRRGSITDRHGFVDTRPRIKLSHLFQ